MPKRDKLNSLPEDLRKIADDLVADKFLDKKEKPTIFAGATIKFAESMEKLEDAIGIPIENVHIDMGVYHDIDPRLGEILQKISSEDDNSLMVRIIVMFRPQSGRQFDRAAFEQMRYNNQTLDMTIVGGHQARKFYHRIKHRIEELKLFYGGDFYAQMERYEFRHVDRTSLRSDQDMWGYLKCDQRI